MKHENSESFWGGIVKAMGLVFGDVGTSPIYTLTVVFALTQPTRSNVFGILSLVFWTMTILVTVEYAWLAMGLGRKGQGGGDRAAGDHPQAGEERQAGGLCRIPFFPRRLSAPW